MCRWSSRGSASSRRARGTPGASCRDRSRGCARRSARPRAPLSELLPKRARFLDLSRTEHPLVPRRERLTHRRRRPDHVDDDPRRGGSGLVRCERDVDAHGGTLAGVTEPLRCYRHPDRETYVSCTECGRGICPDCMSFGPVGIRCPDHASTGGKVAAPKRTARRATASLSAQGPFVTFVLIGINVSVFFLQLVLGSGLRPTSDWIFENGVLFGPLVAEGRVVAPDHLGFPAREHPAPGDEHAGPLAASGPHSRTTWATAATRFSTSSQGSQAPRGRSSGRRSRRSSARRARSGGSWVRRRSSSGGGSTSSADRQWGWSSSTSSSPSSSPVSR